MADAAPSPDWADTAADEIIAWVRQSDAVKFESLPTLIAAKLRVVRNDGEAIGFEKASAVADRVFASAAEAKQPEARADG